MSTTFQTQLNQYGLIAELAQSAIDVHGTPFGKTALQKLVYFLQEVEGVDCGYDFTLYTYGPFSSGLLGDLDVAGAMSGVKLTSDGGYGYHIHPGEKVNNFRRAASPFLDEHKSAIKRVVSEFGAMSAKQLELRATVVYFDRQAFRCQQSLSASEITGKVKSVKPHFEEAVIANAVQQLDKKGYLKALAA